MVTFEEIANGSWFHAGRPVEDVYEANVIFWVTATVMQRRGRPERRSGSIRRLVDVLRETTRTPDTATIWATIKEVPDGSWSVNGRVVGIELFLWPSTQTGKQPSPPRSRLAKRTRLTDVRVRALAVLSETWRRLGDPHQAARDADVALSLSNHTARICTDS